MSLRLFAALALPDEIVERLEQAQAGLPGRLVDPENFHVTLAFFGDVDLAEAEDLAEALQGVAAPGFEMWIEGVDVFGGGKPRIAYAKVRPDPALSLLRDRVRGAARAAGIALSAERFTPHVTLARKPIAADDRLVKWLERGASLQAGPIEVEAFALYRSELFPAGPVYTEAASYLLKTEGFSPETAPE